MKTRINSVSTFLSRIKKGDRLEDCWTWLGTKSIKGYGVFWLKGVQHRAHRFSYSLFVKPIPEGLYVCHKCDNPICVNPSHLFLGTHQDNMDDRGRKGRQAKGIAQSLATLANYPYGDRHGSKTHPEAMLRGEQQSQAKLTEEKVRDIRHRYSSGGVTQRQLAEEYGVSQRAILFILKRIKWAHVE